MIVHPALHDPVSRRLSYWTPSMQRLADTTRRSQKSATALQRPLSLRGDRLCSHCVGDDLLAHWAISEFPCAENFPQLDSLCPLSG